MAARWGIACVYGDQENEYFEDAWLFTGDEATCREHFNDLILEAGEKETYFLVEIKEAMISPNVQTQEKECESCSC